MQELTFWCLAMLKTYSRCMAPEGAQGNGASVTRGAAAAEAEAEAAKQLKSLLKLLASLSQSFETKVDSDLAQVCLLFAVRLGLAANCTVAALLIAEPLGSINWGISKPEIAARSQAFSSQMIDPSGSIISAAMVLEVEPFGEAAWMLWYLSNGAVICFLLRRVHVHVSRRTGKYSNICITFWGKQIYQTGARTPKKYLKRAHI
jgi:hypothetical protein